MGSKPKSTGGAGRHLLDNDVEFKKDETAAVFSQSLGQRISPREKRYSHQYLPIENVLNKVSTVKSQAASSLAWIFRRFVRPKKIIGSSELRCRIRQHAAERRSRDVGFSLACQVALLCACPVSISSSFGRGVVITYFHVPPSVETGYNTLVTCHLSQ